MAKKYASLSTLQTFLDNLKNLFATKTEMDKKADVQIITQYDTETTTEDITTLKIHKLSQEKYDEIVANGNIDETALYLTPDEEIDLTSYATIEQLSDKADAEHIHDNRYYTEAEVDEIIATHTHSYDDLRNKPFYEGTDYSSVFVNGTSAVNFFEWGDGVYGAAITDVPKQLTQDVSCKVIWDGVEYTTTCTYGGDNDSGNPITSIGAPYGDYSTYPFGIDSYKTASGTYEFSIHTNSTASIHIIDILELGSSFVTLDDRFISDNIARTVDVNVALNEKADINHNHNDLYYTKTEIDNLNLIDISDIDAICGSIV